MRPDPPACPSDQPQRCPAAARRCASAHACRSCSAGHASPHGHVASRARIRTLTASCRLSSGAVRAWPLPLEPPAPPLRRPRLATRLRISSISLGEADNPRLRRGSRPDRPELIGQVAQRGGTIAGGDCHLFPFGLFGRRLLGNRLDPPLQPLPPPALRQAPVLPRLRSVPPQLRPPRRPQPRQPLRRALPQPARPRQLPRPVRPRPPWPPPQPRQPALRPVSAPFRRPPQGPQALWLPRHPPRRCSLYRHSSQSAWRRASRSGPLSLWPGKAVARARRPPPTASRGRARPA